MLYSLTKKLFLLFILLTFFSCSSLSELDQKYISKNSNNTNKKTVATKQKKDFSLPYSFNNTRDRKGKITSETYQNLLVKAVESKNIADIKKYINNGANPNRGEDDMEEDSALNIAIATGCYECIKAMSTSADFNFTYYSVNYLPIVVASKHSLEMVQYLFSNFAIDPNAYSHGSHSRGGKHFALNYVIAYGKKGTAKYLLEKGADPMNGRFSAWEYFLKNTKKIQDPIEIANELIKHNVELHMPVKGYAPTSPLGRVLEDEQYEIAKYLLNKGADPNYRDSNSRGFKTPLYWAIRRDSYDMVKLLLEKGERVNILEYNEGKVTTSKTPLSFALDKDRSKRMIDLLLQYGAK